MKTRFALCSIPLLALALAQVPDYTIQPFADADSYGNNGTATSAYFFPSPIKSDGWSGRVENCARRRPPRS